MHHHLDQGDGGDADVFEVVGIGSPWPRVGVFLVVGRVEGVESVAGWVDDFDGILDL